MIFLVEDAPHKSLLCSLGIPRKHIGTMGSKGNVIKNLRDHPRGVGMIDEDPDSIQMQCRELANYQVADEGEGLQLLARQGTGGQRLIVLRPRIEEWLMQRAGLCGIDPRQYYLPSTARALHAFPHYEQKDGFRRFLAELNNHDRGMKLLRRWVS
jgi:hypothetical protein